MRLRFNECLHIVNDSIGYVQICYSIRYFGRFPQKLSARRFEVIFQPAPQCFLCAFFNADMKRLQNHSWMLLSTNNYQIIDQIIRFFFPVFLHFYLINVLCLVVLGKKAVSLWRE